jgi:nicotinate-nucleotide--dimethylbenzimidazole phosphoribosyltransferase
MTDECHKEGCNIICFGEMGIGNTSPSSVWMHLLAGISLEQCIGAGSGLSSTGQQHKLRVLQKAVENYKQSHSDISPVRYFGGFEMAAAIGGMLRAAEHKMIILVDGFIMTACMLAASKENPDILQYAVFGHCGDESGHRLMLNAMNADPLLSLGMRLGEGTGAICAYPLLQSAVNMLNEMDNFDHAQITKYF